VATPADAERAHVPIADLQRGRELLIGKCGGCHDVPKPNDEPRDKWPAQLDDMGKRAGLVGPDRQLIQQYVLAMDLR
jgi:hypothetical protein